MSSFFSRSSAHRVAARKRHLGVVVALAATIAILPNAPAAAGGTVHVGDGESIQAAVDAAEPGTKIIVRGDHAEQVVIGKDGIELIGKDASLSMPDDVSFEPCGPTLICVASPTGDFEDPFNPANQVNDVTISGFTMSNPLFDSIGTYFTNGLTLERNTVTGSDCNAIFLLFATDFQIERNHVAASVNCSTIDVAASMGGTISRNTATDGGFTGINVDDVSDVVIDRNISTGNCIGIVAGNSPGPLGSDNVSITRNTANGNNKVCFPFGEGFPIGGAGILVGGPSNVTVERNTASDNVTVDPTVTPGGIVITDFPSDQGPILTGAVLVSRNTATGNSNGGVSIDLNVNTEGGPVTVSKNHCGFGSPDPGWCTG